MDFWENKIKRNYAGQKLGEYDDIGYFVPLPGVPNIPGVIEGGLWHMEKYLASLKAP